MLNALGILEADGAGVTSGHVFTIASVFAFCSLRRDGQVERSPRSKMSSYSDIM
jgi:hypothetical protein